MSDELTEEVKTVIRKHDPDPSDLRELAGGIEDLADRWEAMEDTL